MIEKAIAVAPVNLKTTVFHSLSLVVGNISLAQQSFSNFLIMFYLEL